MRIHFVCAKFLKFPTYLFPDVPRSTDADGTTFTLTGYVWPTQSALDESIGDAGAPAPVAEVPSAVLDYLERLDKTETQLKSLSDDILATLRTEDPPSLMQWWDIRLETDWGAWGWGPEWV
eukprot:SAG31_NODE_1702_length_7496_cov_2.367311_1_plen_121_part_00